MRHRITLSLAACVAVSSAGAWSLGSPDREAREVALLRRDAVGPVELTQDPQSETPSFIRARVPVSTLALVAPDTSAVDIAFGFCDRYAALLGIDDPQEQLRPLATVTDDLGMTHIAFRQVHEGVPVYAASLRLHLSRDGEAVLAVGNRFVPRIRVRSVVPEIAAEAAVTAARAAMPSGVAGAPELLIYPGIPATGSPRLTWWVELRDDALPARNAYLIDAFTGEIVDVLDRLYTARDRRTYDAGNERLLPGTLRRSETDGPFGDADVDQAHDFAADTYDYYANTHGRDSYDDAGATLLSTAHYGVEYLNAFWNGEQMVYGDGFAVNDVAAHEITHAVTEHTAGLVFRWQSGALNESLSDIFGAMVDREDWFMGEDLPIGALRDLSDPASFGDPAHIDDWVETCFDREGVHTNSGIPSKAFVNIATGLPSALGRERAERIFYRTLVTYLQATSSLEDARAAALQSADDLYGLDSEETQAVAGGFDAVGLDGVWHPPVNDCS